MTCRGMQIVKCLFRLLGSCSQQAELVSTRIQPGGMNAALVVVEKNDAA